MISSARPSPKYSFCLSALMLANGSTATDVSAAECGMGSTRSALTSAAANCAGLVKRFAGSFAIARTIVASTLSGTESRTSRIEGTASVRCFAMIDCADGPVNGTSPDSIS